MSIFSRVNRSLLLVYLPACFDSGLGLLLHPISLQKMALLVSTLTNSSSHSSIVHEVIRFHINEKAFVSTLEMIVSASSVPGVNAAA